MAKSFDLDFHGTRFTVPKLSLFNLFEHQRGLFDAVSYGVQSSGPAETFQVFVKALETGGKVPVTIENAGAVSLLAKEFWRDHLITERLALQVASTPELIAALAERISTLEHQISSQPLALIAELKESIAHHERRLECLDDRFSGLERNLTKAPTYLTKLKSRFPAPVQPSDPLKFTLSNRVSVYVGQFP
jgi:uncharacterized coiled-coil protein SlyX